MRNIVSFALHLLCVLYFPAAVYCVAHYNRLNTRAFAADSAEDAWQPRTTTTQHRNWIILQRTEADRRSQLRRASHMRAHMYDDGLPHRLPVNYYAYNQSTGNYALPPQDVHEHEHEHVNDAVAVDDVDVVDAVDAVEPFVLAISKLKRRDNDAVADSDTMHKRQNVLPPNRKHAKDNSNIINKYKTKQRYNNNDNVNRNNGKHLQKSQQYKQNVNRNVASAQQPQSRTEALIPQEIDEQDTIGGARSVAAPNADTAVNNANDDEIAAADNLNGIDVADDDDDDDDGDDDDDDSQEKDADEDKQQLHEMNEMLMPLQYALDKVIEFCDVAKRLLRSHDDDAEEIDEHALTASSASSSLSSTTTTSSSAQSSTAPVAVAEVQGRASLPAHSAAKSSTLTTFGTSRKLKIFKKKLAKLMFPLLIAYKLKFLTLVPVLIGGLILLVGTTGMAGFFFALFAAVMSLKSGGGKSIVVKKF